MSGFGGFGGFGQNNNNQQQQSTGFGGFGSTPNTNTGFGATNNTGFGSTNTTGGGLFGGGSTGFGSSGGFGSSANNAFGAKPGGFGATTTTSGGSLFGGGTATAGSTGFGGFGATPAATSSPFGGSNTTGGLFGGNKTGFGTNTTTTSSLFGGGTTSTPFGGTSSAFGAPAATALGGNSAECQGTGSVPFQAYIEKEPNSTSNQQNAFQSISFQQPYQKFSPEELRLADYAQGRRYGNASGQPGAFGTSSGFGFGNNNQNTATGFGASTTGTGTSLFGATSSSPFGNNQTQNTGFGANNTTAGGGLFGQKPTTGGLFGATPAQSSGGLFGGTGTAGFGNASTGFGSTNNSAGTSLFGGNNTTANKPAFSFGNSQPASTGTGFGSTPAATGGFGTGGLFGNNQQQQNTTSPFNTQPQPAANNPFGGFGGNTQQQTGTTSLFGTNNQQKPAGGLFGSPAASGSGGLFGNTQPAANTNPFNTSANNQSGGLFGQKPATGSGLFGTPNNTTSNAGGSSLFSNFGNQNQNQPQQSTGGLFGGLNNNSQPKPSLFSQPQQQQGSSLFGNPGSQSGGLFGTPNNTQQQQQQPQNSLFGSNSIFGGSQQNQQTPQSLTTSISDNAAYGSASLFSNLASTQVNNPGPLATPLSSVSKQKKAAPLPLYKLNSSSSRFTTPQKRGFGFSYSNYTTPTSAASAASTPGTFGGSSFGGTFSRALSKSVSTSNLRRTFNSEDGILAPGAFSVSSGARHYGSTGSMKKLVINRSIRSDLFSPPNPQSQTPASNPPQGGILKKRVSFDSSTVTNGASSPLKEVHNNATSTPEKAGSSRQRQDNGAENSNGRSSSVEMEQVPRNNELAIVHEEEATTPAASKSQAQPESPDDGEPGRYWMSPTKEEIESMNRAQRQKVSGFTVGRENVGSVTFDVPVDLSNINLDSIMGGLVVLTIRMCTVYPDNAAKPPMGKGLNVPAVISLEKSRPRAKDRRASRGDGSSAHIKKHIERLKHVNDTEFIGYDDKKGTWTFKVPHFTTYGVPDDDEESDAEGDTDFGQSTLSAPPDTPTPSRRTPKHGQLDESYASTSQLTETESDPEDTFQFKKKKILPGAFDDQEVFEDDEDMEESYQRQDKQSFLDERSVGSLSEDGAVEPMDQDDVFTDDESVSIVDQEMAGAFPQADNTAEHEDDSQDDDEEYKEFQGATPGSLTRSRMRSMKSLGTPSKGKFTANNDWTNTLRATISPQKQDRALLKSLAAEEGNGSPLRDVAVPIAKRVVSDGRGFATSIDIMNSLFPQSKSPAKVARVSAKAKGFEWPYAKRSKQDDNDRSAMSEADCAFHQSVKPAWGPDGTLVYAAPPSSKPFGRSSRRIREKEGLISVLRGGIVSEKADIRFAKFSNEASADHIKKQKAITIIDKSHDGVPAASLPEMFSCAEFFDDHNSGDPAATHEKLVWQLASVLFDEITIPKELVDFPEAVTRLRKDKLSEFWQKLVDHASVQQVAMARSHEEKAIAALSGHRVADALGHLVNGKNFRLATLVALICDSSSMKTDIREQLNDWQKSKVLSEFNQPIRTIYEFLAGNVCVCNGSKGPVEDRIESFVISKRFGLDWRQAFGLRLWYAISTTDDIASAVEKYEEDLAQEKETAIPQAWYVEQKVPTLWKDDKLETREDLLWGLLKLYVFQDADLEAILAPENSQLSPLDVRLAWQLSQALTSAGVAQYSKDASDTADHVTFSFAAQLTNEGSWLDAIFVLLHLSSTDARAKSIRNHLAHHAGLIGSEDSDAFTAITQTFKIPTSWIWEAKALYMRSVEKSPQKEVECLLKAGAFNEAHRTFTKQVAPKAIVECDYDILRAILKGFHGKENTTLEWHLGGQIYHDFLELLDSQKRGKTIDGAVLERLLAGLPAAVESSRHHEFMETVAVEIMGDVVAKCVLAAGKKGEKSGFDKVLRLPLSEDKYLRHTVELSLEYYKAVMATGR